MSVLNNQMVLKQGGLNIQTDHSLGDTIWAFHWILNNQYGVAV